MELGSTLENRCILLLYYVCMWQMRSNNQKTKSNAKIKHLLFGGKSKAERGKVRRKRREGYRDFWGHLLLPVILREMGRRTKRRRNEARRQNISTCGLEATTEQRDQQRGPAAAHGRKRGAKHASACACACAGAWKTRRGRPRTRSTTRGKAQRKQHTKTRQTTAAQSTHATTQAHSTESATSKKVRCCCQLYKDDDTVGKKNAEVVLLV